MSRDVPRDAAQTSADPDTDAGRPGWWERRHIPRTPGSALLAVALAGVAVGLTAPAAAAAPGLAPNEPATAVAGRSTAYLEATFTGYLRYVEPDGTSRQEPVTVQHRCSGVVVNPDGHVVTAGGCVRPDERELLADARYALARSLVEAARLPADGLDGFVRSIGGTASFTGSRRGTRPASTLWGQLGIARPGSTGTSAIRATVVRVEGNLALVRLSRSGLSAIEVGAGESAGPDNQVLVLGYGPDEPDSGSGEYRQRARPVEVTGEPGPERLAGDGLGPSFRGSPVLDADGRLRAILDSDPRQSDPAGDGTAESGTAESGTAASGAVDSERGAGAGEVSGSGERSRRLVPAAEVAELLADAGVANRLSEVDLAYRAGLDAYFAGQFSTAVRRFDDLLRVTPSHSSAQTYRDRAQHRLDVDGDAVENSAEWLRYLLSAAAGVLLIVAAGRIWRFALSRVATARHGPLRRRPRPPGPPRTAGTRPAEADPGTTEPPEPARAPEPAQEPEPARAPEPAEPAEPGSSGSGSSGSGSSGSGSSTAATVVSPG